MTLNELKKLIAVSPNKDWYLRYLTPMNFPHLNYSGTVEGVPALYDFVLKQIAGFGKYGNLPQELTSNKNKFEDLKNVIISLVERNNVDEYTWNNNTNFLRSNSPFVFLTDAPETDFLIKLHNEQPVYYKGAYEYILGSLNHSQNKNYWVGYMLAYEFTSKGFSKIAERKEAEKKSIAAIRGDFQDKLGEAELEVVEYFDKSNKKFEEYAQKIDDLHKEKEKEFKEWYNRTVEAFNDFNNTSAGKMIALQKTYEEKLKLEAPAQYWSQRATKLRKEGWRWLWCLIGSLVVSVIVLAIILNMTANGTLQKVFAETSTAIKWSVTLITLISFLAYGVRTFAKLTFSSFHLVRDAEEREQLTFVYLALQNEAKVDQTERHLIMQSLFSRADSGLLKDDSGPTMPGNIVDQAFKGK